MDEKNGIRLCPLMSDKQALSPCMEASCALYAEGECAFVIIADKMSALKDLRGIASGANGIWGELKDRY